MKIGIIGAMDIEVCTLVSKMDNDKCREISTITFHEGKIHGIDTVVATAGVGKVNAAVCAQTMILEYAPDCIINTGVAGGLAKGLKVGDIVVAESVAEHDMDTSPLGDEKGFITGLNRVYMDCDEKISGIMYECADKTDGINAVRGIIASGDQFIASDEARERIIKEFNASAAEMEGASIGHVCAMNGIPFAVLRSMSDTADDEASMSFPEFAEKAAEISVSILEKMLIRLKGENL